MTFQGKFAVVTGGGTGIGFATAQMLGREGARICVVGRRRDVLDQAVDSLCEQGVIAIGRPVDVSERSLVERFCEVLKSDTEKVDVLVHSAGVTSDGRFWELSEKSWEEAFDINVKGIYLVTKFLMPMLEKAGASVVNIASTLAYQVIPGASVYSASKAAVVSLTKSMALELAEKEIRVNCICPGIVDTPMQDPFWGVGEKRSETLERIGRTLPLGRVGRSEDIARAVLFLASDAASWITGSILTVDGGISLLAR